VKRFSFATIFRPDLEPIQPPLQWVPGVPFLLIERAMREAHLHLVSRWIRGTIHPSPQYMFMAWCLIKHRGNFTFLPLV